MTMPRAEEMCPKCGIRLELHRWGVCPEWAEKVVGMGLPRETVLQEAERLIHGERAAQHGPVKETFTKIATIFDAMLSAPERNRMQTGATPVTAVAKMLIALKLARASYNPGHRDNLVDAAGYIGLLDELIKAQ